MLRHLFSGLTKPARGQALFDRVVAEARRPHWYRDGAVPDSIDGRFAMLASVMALTTLRLETASEATRLQSPALTERFIEAMDAEHRQLGMNDPALGKTVRKLVGALARRVESWRPAIAGEGDWDEVARDSVFGDSPAEAKAQAHVASGLRDLWQRLERADDEALGAGTWA